MPGPRANGVPARSALFCRDLFLTRGVGRQSSMADRQVRDIQPTVATTLQRRRYFLGLMTILGGGFLSSFLSSFLDGMTIVGFLSSFFASLSSFFASLSSFF